MNKKIVYTQQDLINKYPNVKYCLGLDECGTGAGAGTATVGLTVLPIDSDLKVKDSKKYTLHTARKKASNLVLQKALVHQVFDISAHIINEKGLGNSKNEAILALLEEVLLKFDFKDIVAVMDGDYIPELPLWFNRYHIIASPKADVNIAACSAASVIAKVHRDEYMMDLHQNPLYNMYGFNKNKGYLTLEHIEALKQHGPSIQHRMIKPVKDIIKWREKQLLTTI